MDCPNSIECANFEMGSDTILFEELMGSIIYSSSGRYAVAVKEDFRTCIYILDAFTMKIYRYISLDPYVEFEFEILNWSGDFCVITLYCDAESRKFIQTPIFLDHSTRTFAVEEPRSYNFSNFGLPFSKTRSLPTEGSIVVLEGQKYVIWISSKPSGGYYSVVYAIPFESRLSIEPKKFLIPLSWHNIVLKQSTIMTGLIAAAEPSLILHSFTSNASFLGSTGFFPCRVRYARTGATNKQLLGVYQAIDFKQLIDYYNVDINESNRMDVSRSFREQENAWSIVECAPNDTSTIHEDIFCRTSEASKRYGQNIVTLVKEVDAESLILTEILYTDFPAKKITNVYKSSDFRGEEPVISFTPFNILVATKESATKINCSTITLPNGNTMLSLKDTVLRYLYLNSHCTRTSVEDYTSVFKTL